MRFMKLGKDRKIITIQYEIHEALNAAGKYKLPDERIFGDPLGREFCLQFHSGSFVLEDATRIGRHLLHGSRISHKAQSAGYTIVRTCITRVRVRNGIKRIAAS